jgi:hypothetical protein
LNKSTLSSRDLDIETAQHQITCLIDNIEQVVYGKRDVIKLCLVGLLARGHLLIEDIPGVGKTTIAQALALSIDCSFNRIQFTSDMLPADILGVSILKPDTQQFEFRQGPIFSSILLADEVLEQLNVHQALPVDELESIAQFLVRYHEIRFGQQTLHEHELNQFSSMIKQLNQQPATQP